MASFPERLNNLLTHRNLKGSDLAEATGIDPGAISMYLRGRREPSFKSLLKIASILNTSLDYLCGVSDNREEHTIIRSVPDITCVVKDLSTLDSDKFDTIARYVNLLSNENIAFIIKERTNTEVSDDNNSEQGYYRYQKIMDELFVIGSLTEKEEKKLIRQIHFIKFERGNL